MHVTFRLAHDANSLTTTTTETITHQ